jgi:hypothetical protein
VNRTILCLLPILLLTFPERGDAQAGHDGDWWKGLSPVTKQNVVAGFLDGMALGHNLTVMGSGNSSEADCRTKIAQSYSYVRTRYFQNVAPGDLVSALDQLYSETDNSSIIIGRAVWIAVNRLGGSNRDDIQKLILQSRGVGY